MAVLFTMLVLVAGYHYARSLPSEKVNLKRSAGWETYVYLGFHGLRFLIQSLWVLLLLWVSVYLILSTADWGFDSSMRLWLQRQITRILFDDIQVYHVLIAAFAWALCQNEIKGKIKRGNKLVFENIKNYDGLLRVVFYRYFDLGFQIAHLSLLQKSRLFFRRHNVSTFQNTSIKNCYNSRLSSSGAANAFKIPTTGTFGRHVRLSRL